MDFVQCLEKLESAGMLARVKSDVDPVRELAGVASHFDGKQVLLFEKIHGQKFPLAMGLWWNRHNIAHLFDTTADKLPARLSEAVAILYSAPAAPVVVADARSGQNTHPHAGTRRRRRIP